MRSSKSRSRNKSNRNRNNPGNIINRVFDSSGPEGKVRGTPQQIIDKYNQLTRDAFLSNDRVAGENFQQHAEHYTRLLGEAQREIETRRQQADQQNRERQQRDKGARADRADASANPTPEQSVPGEGDQPDLGQAPQPEVAETSDNGLVETPESKPRRQPSRARKPRKPAARKDDAASTDAAPAPVAEASDPSGEAAE
ncbi:protein of unknown function [Aliiroseovarius halocynthiae]|uniref:DUF4167 domain-containing protein n=1 Tax=Aliiroseovarius halocynthiae TaxID=985055 RepID=A0A545SWK3_9RHOB|nr:DUF4167 domain-containing protein [Aliiroseovarius halocynthiae]TQV69338.1 DUF4167 domain-containing protein [Aliiroseovarius halocynthiae]SMR72237.1 protein of unknown function [Aliiroseovarius halocynthiae]